jgi:hypothetical protein
VGEEAHIVAKSPGGARAGLLDERELDAYDNLILLCRVDHKLVDDQRQTYPPDRLRKIKADHEAWVRAALEEESQPEPIQVVDDPAFGPVQLHLLGSGKDVWDVVAHTHSYLCDGPDERAISPEACEAVDIFLDLAKDWGEISAEVTDQGRKSVREAQRSLGEQLSELGKHALVAYGCRQRRIVKGGVTHPAHWWQAWLVVRRVEDVLVTGGDGSASAPETTASPT